ncbi:MAG: pyridoxal-phosphate dependent enzyme [Ferruginibacter sp.]
MLFPTTATRMQPLEFPLLAEKQVAVSVLRLDEIHPIVSGNKLFKLHYFLQDALQRPAPGIVTFGGAYSNHLAATAFACSEYKLKSIGIVRGEQPAILSHTLQQCRDYGMQLIFVSREQYARKEGLEFLNDIDIKYKDYLIVPEGGYHPSGALGAALIMDLVGKEVTHICCAVGTATTLAGLLLGASDSQQVVGFPVLKGMDDLQERLLFLTAREYSSEQLQIMNSYLFGGYAKRMPALIDFMNSFFNSTDIPTDFVYTAKMMFGVMDCINKNFFPTGSRIVCMHTGGLQGNLSLPGEALSF